MDLAKMFRPSDRFVDYYRAWMHLYKEGSIKEVTMARYRLVLKELEDRWPNLAMNEIDHYYYQKLVNDYAENHEYLTVKCFHHHIKSAIMDAMDDDLIAKDPTRHLRLHGRQPKPKKIKYLNLIDLKRLLAQLKLDDELNLDHLILLVAKTGMRFAEALGVTVNDFDFDKHQLNIDKTWDYKSSIGSFQPTKNRSSQRVIELDPLVCEQFEELTKDLNPEEPIFCQNKKRVYVATVNNHLKKYCEKAGIDIISIHGLRHTHASLLIYDGVSIPSVSKRLGHANTITTQQTYLHIVKELEIRDNQKIMENMIRLS